MALALGIALVKRDVNPVPINSAEPARVSGGFRSWAESWSAGHCGDNTDRANTGGGTYMGDVFLTSKSHARLLISVGSTGRIYYGSVCTREFSKPVFGAKRSYVGDWLCVSGAYSRVQCDGQVKAINQMICVKVGTTQYAIYEPVMVEQKDKIDPISNGCSGGPVFDLTGPIPDHIITEGTKTAIYRNQDVPCEGVPGGQNWHCAWRLYYIDVANSLDALRCIDHYQLILTPCRCMESGRHHPCPIEKPRRADRETLVLIHSCVVAVLLVGIELVVIVIGPRVVLVVIGDCRCRRR